MVLSLQIVAFRSAKRTPGSFLAQPEQLVHNSAWHLNAETFSWMDFATKADPRSLTVAARFWPLPLSPAFRKELPCCRGQIAANRTIAGGGAVLIIPDRFQTGCEDQSRL